MVERPADEHPVRSILVVSRIHIVVIAAMAALTFSWILTGHQYAALPFIVGFDWFLVNLLNRVVDLDEDALNGVVGTSFVDAHAKVISWVGWGALAVSFPVVHVFFPRLTPFRVLFHLIGVAYNYRIIPSPSGLRRFKELYFFKNFASGALFLISGILYPLAAESAFAKVTVVRVLLLAGFYLFMDITYEIFYDLRDLEGDRRAGVPTFPVVHGEKGARRLVIAFLIGAALFLLGGYGAGVLRFAEVVMVLAVVQQALFYVKVVPKGLTQTSCIVVTWLGAAQLLSYNLWVWLGLPLEPWWH